MPTERRLFYVSVREQKRVSLALFRLSKHVYVEYSAVQVNDSDGKERQNLIPVTGASISPCLDR
jgi:hypothetical protein